MQDEWEVIMDGGHFSFPNVDADLGTTGLALSLLSQDQNQGKEKEKEKLVKEFWPSHVRSYEELSFKVSPYFIGLKSSVFNSNTR